MLSSSIGPILSAPRVLKYSRGIARGPTPSARTGSLFARYRDQVSLPRARAFTSVLILFKYLNSSNATTRAGLSGGSRAAGPERRGPPLAQLRGARNRVLYTPRITLPDVHTTDEYQLPMPATFLRDVMRAFNAFKRLCALSDVFAGTTWRLVAAKHRLA